MTGYEQALSWLLGRVNYERMDAGTFRLTEFRLDRMRLLLDRLGNPQTQIPVAHIAGTKGKGSTAAMLAEILHTAGYRVGLYTSPHLSAFEERMRVNGQLPTADQFTECVQRVRSVVDELDQLTGDWGPTYFEIATAIAWIHFASQRAQIVVLEVGLGGRLDATNVCQPLVTVITSISRDHTRQLGATIDLIAAEKAGIAKPGCRMINGATQPEAIASINRACAAASAPIWQLGVDFSFEHAPNTDVEKAPSDSGAADHSNSMTVVAPVARNYGRFALRHGSEQLSDLPLSLAGFHQAHNASLAVMAVRELTARGFPVSESEIRRGLASVYWPGRAEVVGECPTVVLDAAHNWSAISAVLQTLRTQFRARKRILVFAASRDKDTAGMLRQLLGDFDTILLTEFHSNPRAVSCTELARIAARISCRPVHVVADPIEAWNLARSFASGDDLVCITGSVFIVGELRPTICAASSSPSVAGS